MAELWKLTISCNKLFKNIIVFLCLGMWEQNDTMETLLRAFILLHILDRHLLPMLFSSAEWYKKVNVRDYPEGKNKEKQTNLWLSFLFCFLLSRTVVEDIMGSAMRKALRKIKMWMGFWRETCYPKSLHFMNPHLLIFGGSTLGMF